MALATRGALVGAQLESYQDFRKYLAPNVKFFRPNIINNCKNVYCNYSNILNGELVSRKEVVSNVNF